MESDKTRWSWPCNGDQYCTQNSARVWLVSTGLGHWVDYFIGNSEADPDLKQIPETEDKVVVVSGSVEVTCWVSSMWILPDTFSYQPSSYFSSSAFPSTSSSATPSLHLHIFLHLRIFIYVFIYLSFHLSSMPIWTGTFSDLFISLDLFISDPSFSLLHLFISVLWRFGLIYFWTPFISLIHLLSNFFNCYLFIYLSEAKLQLH